ncbi:phage tail family protein [Streptomyces sp. NRRL B-24484]|uniref:phage tail family protein n=1 Tax=Streptomyces sp. NRRL B-24484 TaxID=1463833 RepID=UPI0006943A90|nr:phage tail family protein [Streptomyces sp. NRRL B-24484]
MPAGDKVTAPGHVQFGDLLLGPGTPYRWRTIAGWEDTPGLDSGTINRPAAHGAYPGELWAQPRTITLDGITIRSPADQIGATVRQLAAGTALSTDEQPLVVQLDERGPLMVFARCLRRAIPVGKGYRVGTITGAALQWEASDPRRYSLAEQSAETGLPRDEAGLDWHVSPSGPVQVLPALQAAGQTPLTAWWALQGLTLGSTAGAATVTVTAATSNLPAQVAWVGPAGGTSAFPVRPGDSVTFRALQLPAGAEVNIEWSSAAGDYLSTTYGQSADQVSGAAPANAAYVRPIMEWDAIPTPATVPIGASTLTVPSPYSESLLSLDLGTAGSTGTLTAYNAGNADAPAQLAIRGPISGPTLTDMTTGRTWSYDIELAAGDELLVDSAAGTVTLGGASRLYTATSTSAPEQLLVIPPGVREFAFRAAPDTPTDPAARAVLRWRHAYW